jgi:hypothetical protein
MKLVLLVSLAIVLRGCEKPAPAAPRPRFYDFETTLTIRNPISGNQQRFILANLSPESAKQSGSPWHASRLKPNTLHVIRYSPATSPRNKRRKLADAQDTVRIELRRGQMDTIYVLTAALFALPPDQNRALAAPALAPKVTEDISATVDFNLGSRGHHYKAYLQQAGYNFGLYAYLQRLLAGYQRRHPAVS